MNSGLWMRMCALFCALPALLVTACGEPQTSESPDLDESEFEIISESDKDFFVGGAMVFTFYHELGHALVDQLDIPILGREEDAVDNLATLLITKWQPKELREDLIFASADSFGWQDDYNAATGEALDLSGEHSTDLQRFYNIACTFYGSDPERLGAFANAARLPEDRQEVCPIDFKTMAKGWSEHLGKIERQDGGSRSGKVLVKWDVVKTASGHALRTRLEQSSLLTKALRMFNETYALDKDIVVRYEECDEANAFFDEDTKEVIMCYELAAEFEKLYDWAQPQL